MCGCAIFDRSKFLQVREDRQMTLRGTLELVSVEGGVWLFKTDDGGQYQVEGLPTQYLTTGKRLELEGDVDRQAFTIGMMGAVFKVRSAREI